MNKLIGGLLATLLISSPLQAGDLCTAIDFSKVDARQYCLYNGQLYTRGIRIKTDTGTYTCRFAGSTPAGPRDVKEMLSWVRETI